MPCTRAIITTATAAALACIMMMVIVPFIFESYTFHLYTVRDPSFFTFSGARLWVFLIAEVALGFMVGSVASSIRTIIASGLVAAAVAMLIAILYHFCHNEQCYYSGPDGSAEFRLGTLLFATATIGVMMGSWSRPIARKKNNAPEGVLFATVTVIFLGYYPWALLFANYMPSSLGLAMLGLAALVPFLFSGIVSRHFANSLRYSVCTAAGGWGILALLFATLRPSSAALPPLLLPTIILPFAIAASVAGCALLPLLPLSKARKNGSAIILASLLAIFALSAAHPFIDSPMNLEVDPDDDDLLPQQPTYYSGAYHQSEKGYFSTKRVEVEINLAQFDPELVKDFIIAGIGVQSPNCCKDGLDYGYRTDLLFNGSGIFLVARAWETCDLNIACSGFPWISTMHKSITRLEEEGEEIAGKSVMLAMEWMQDGRTAGWHYKAGRNDWKEYSRFVSPSIGNPYFNLGVIGVGNPFPNPDSGNAFFYQAGVSSPEQDSVAGGTALVAFHCPAYYDTKGVKHCVELEPILRGNSHWKVLWKWGIQGDESVVTGGGSQTRIKLE